MGDGRGPSRRYDVGSATGCQRRAPFVSPVSQAVGTQPLWASGKAGRGANAGVGVADQQGLELPRLATSNAKMARKPRAAAQASQAGRQGRLGFGYGHPWCLEMIKKQEKGAGQGGRDAPSWDLGTRADVRAEILSSKHRILPSSEPLWAFGSGSNPNTLTTVAGRSARLLAASTHGCDLKHSGRLQLEGTPLNSLGLSRRSFATHPTHESRPGSSWLFRRLHPVVDSHLVG